MWVLERNQSGVVAQVSLFHVLRQSSSPRFCEQHSAPIKEIAFVQDAGLLLTASWDKTLKYWDVRTQAQPKATVPLPERAYAMAVNGNLIVVGTADRHVVVYDFRKPQVPYRVSLRLLFLLSVIFSPCSASRLLLFAEFVLHVCVDTAITPQVPVQMLGSFP